jgi:hypothetical protein
MNTVDVGRFVLVLHRIAAECIALASSVVLDGKSATPSESTSRRKAAWQAIVKVVNEYDREAFGISPKHLELVRIDR